MTATATEAQARVRPTGGILCVGGIDFPMDSRGRVDLSAMKRYMKRTDKSPAQWARSARFGEVVKRLLERTGLQYDDVWVVDGLRKAARTWVHPEIAKAYIEELDCSGADPNAMARTVAALEGRVKLLEETVDELLEQFDVFDDAPSAGEPGA